MKKTKFQTWSDFGDFLRENREKINLTQGELAKILGYGSPQFVSNWERGLARPPAQKLRELMKLLKIKRSELLDILTELERSKWERKI